MTSSLQSFRQSLFSVFSFILVLGTLISCSVTRDVPEGDLLLNKMKIKVDDRSMKSEIRPFVKQKANQQLLFVTRFKLRFYSSFLFRKQSNSKLRHSIGEPPVIFDSLSADGSVKQIKAYLKNKGHYESHVSYETKVRKSNHKKLKITYHIKTGRPILIKQFETDIKDRNIMANIDLYKDKSLVEIGDKFDLDVLEAERSRITRFLQKNAYFFFSNDLILYTADTSREKYAVYLKMKLKKDPQMYFGDSTKVDPYDKYKVRNIYVRQSFEDSPTLFMESDTLNEFGYEFLGENQFTVKPKAVSRSIFLKPHHHYQLEEHENTFRRLSALNNYKYINISYLSTPELDSLKNLDCLISLSPSKPKSFNVETNGTNTGGNLGVNGSFSFSNRNAFRGAELLRFTLYGGLEAQSVKNSSSNDEVVSNTPFNTLEIGPEISLVFPRFLLPVDESRFAKRFIPKTSMTISYNYQKRPDYTRNIINTALSYSWKESKAKSHSIHPANLSQIQIDKSDEFTARLDSIGSSSLKASYEDQFISSFMYNFVLNNQRLNKGSSYQILRAHIEFAGNLFYTLDQNVLNSTPNENGQYTINGIPYAQFIRSYVEYIHNFKLMGKSRFASRTFIGVGYPYGNSPSLPFVRSFYGGGTNGIRAWVARSIGPGNLPNEVSSSASVDQIGDIKFEENLEYRWVIFKYLEGALFSDIGNIWTFTDRGDYGQLQMSNFWRDLAIGAGVGARLNFDFFIIRFDVAKRVKDPGAEDPYAIKFFYSDPPVYNFAIGYPF